MPSANKNAETAPTGTSRLPDDVQTLAVFNWPGLYNLGRVVTTLMKVSGRGRKSPYGPTVLLAVCIVARVCGSHAAGLKHLRSGTVWQGCREAYHAHTGIWLPAVPPNREQVDYFRTLLDESPGILLQLKAAFLETAVKQARRQGNLLPGVSPNWAAPELRHLIYGDGVTIKPYSDVVLVPHPRTGEAVPVGSRARSATTARVQTLFSDTQADGKSARGLNLVSFHTWIPGTGRITLATGAADGAEQWAALDLLNTVMAGAGDGVHTLAYDRVFNGWLLEYCMANHRIRVVNKSVGRSSDTDDTKANKAEQKSKKDAELTVRVGRLAAEYDAPLTASIASILRRDILAGIFYSGRPQPLGTCPYPTENNYDVVRSRFYKLEEAAHETPAGRCTHHLHVDDGGQGTVEPDPIEGYLVKIGHAECLSSTPRVQDDGCWASEELWRIPCDSGDFEYRIRWDPAATRYTKSSPTGDRAPADMALCELRPLSRADGQRFNEVAFRRNDAESSNNSYQLSLPYYGRAASLSPVQQEFDYLTFAALTNALTWAARHRG